MKSLRLLLCLLCSICSALAEPYGFGETPTGQRFSNEDAFEVLTTYTRIALALYCDTLDAALVMQEAIERLCAEPSSDALDEARRAWIKARQLYGQTEVFRFCNSPIDKFQLEIPINSWPIDESFIDYTRESPESGFINTPEAFPAVSPETLLSLNEKHGETHIMTGWHAIEFLLWGQDFNDNGPGNRPWTDFSEHPHAARRCLYLKAATQLLVNQLQVIAEQWQPGSYSNYLGSFFIRRPPAILRDALNGIIMLCGNEMAGERISVALKTRSQEDEHSCFSDTTHLDLEANMKGIVLLLEGKYIRADGTTISGKGFYDLFITADEQGSHVLKLKADDALKQIQSLPAPFDQALLVAEPAPASVAAYQKAASRLWDVSHVMIDLMERLGIAL